MLLTGSRHGSLNPEESAMPRPRERPAMREFQAGERATEKDFTGEQNDHAGKAES